MKYQSIINNNTYLTLKGLSMSNIYINPPRWCSDAVPSNKGWCHPVSGELLISVPGGIPVVGGFKQNQALSVEDTVITQPNVSIIDERVIAPVINEKIIEKVILDEKVKTSKIIEETVKTKKPLLDVVQKRAYKKKEV